MIMIILTNGIKQDTQQHMQTKDQEHKHYKRGKRYTFM